MKRVRWFLSFFSIFFSQSLNFIIKTSLTIAQRVIKIYQILNKFSISSSISQFSTQFFYYQWVSCVYFFIFVDVCNVCSWKDFRLCMFYVFDSVVIINHCKIFCQIAFSMNVNSRLNDVCDVLNDVIVSMWNILWILFCVCSTLLMCVMWTKKKV